MLDTAGSSPLVDHPEARRNTDLYESAASQQRDWSDQAAENVEYYFGSHWTSENKAILEERGQQPIAIQATYQIVEQAVGMLTANRPAFRATPRENGDRKLSAVWSDLFQWMWQQSRGQQRFMAAVRDYYVQGRGVACAYIDWNADFGKGEVLWRDLDPKEVFPDPRSVEPLWDDASFVIVRRLFTLPQIEKLWGKGVADLVKQSGSKKSDLPFSSSKASHRDHVVHPQDIASGWARGDQDEQYEVIERYEKVPRPFHRLFNVETGHDEILDQKAFAERMGAPAYIQTVGGVEQVIISPDRVSVMDQTYDQLGPVFHFHQPPPMVGPDGSIVPQEPFPMPGPEDGVEGAIPGSTTALQPVTVGELVESGAIPHVEFQMYRVRVIGSSGDVLLYEPYDLPTQHYPIVAFPNSANRNPYPISDVDRLKDLQDMVNKTQSLILAHQATSTNLKVFYPEGSIIDTDKYEQEWAKAGTAMIPYNPAYGVGGSSPGGIVIASPPPLPAALFGNMDRAIALMERIAGLYAFQQGQIDQAPNTFRGTLAMDEFGLRRMKHKLDTIYGSLERLGAVMLEMAQTVYTDRKVIRITQPDGRMAEQEISGYEVTPEGRVISVNDITVGQYDVMIVAGSTLPSNRWALLETYLQMYDRGLVDDVAVLRSTEIPDAEEIIERKSIIQQQAAALQQHAEQIAALQGDLQTWQREAMHAKQRSELEKFKARLAKLESDTRKNVEVFRFALDKDRTQIRAQEMVQKEKRIAQAAGATGDSTQTETA